MPSLGAQIQTKVSYDPMDNVATRALHRTNLGLASRTMSAGAVVTAHLVLRTPWSQQLFSLASAVDPAAWNLAGALTDIGSEGFEAYSQEEMPWTLLALRGIYTPSSAMVLEHRHAHQYST